MMLPARGPATPTTETELVIRTPVEITLQRGWRRRRCPACTHKRVLFSVRLGQPALPDSIFGQTEWRCLPCWGGR